jgi:serine/threonine protein phosphatase PrpC
LAGDAQLKPYVTADPEIRVVDRAEETWFLIIATDGLWDVISNKEAVQV